jgi:predicted ATPase
MQPALLLCRAEVMLDVEGAAAAEPLMLEAIRVARRQQDGWHELHAAMALARLWQGQGRCREARELLQPVYDWFTEGLDTAPLLEARALLDELGSS